MANDYERQLEMKRARKRERELKGKYGGLTNFRLKVIGAILMAFSVSSYTVMPLFVGDPTADDNMLGMTVVVVFEAISWLAVPIYAWLLYSGFDHTRSQIRYAVELFVVALVCEVPYDMCTGTHELVDFSSQNPVWGLLLALGALMLLDSISLAKMVRWLRIVLYVVVIGVGLLWNYLFRIGQTGMMVNIGMLTLGFVVIFFFLDKRENTMMITAALLGAVTLLTPGFGVAFLHYRNDELGYRHDWTKWVFYCIYPIELILGMLVVMFTHTAA
ncbi:MAG: TraX family protein [Bifidobacterium sp.]|nr:TraX family protein [Bifidobacterium sp.]